MCFCRTCIKTRNLDVLVAVKLLNIPFLVTYKYDFYFRSLRGFFTIPDPILWRNIINEKVMIAEELK